MLRCIAKLCAGLVVIAASASALAQDYPNKPVKLLVPFAAGGPADVYARIEFPQPACKQDNAETTS